MRFRVQVGAFRKDGTAQAWWEEFDKDIDDPDAWAEETIKRFNATLYPGERERFWVQTEILERDSIKDHDWMKTNLVTISGRGSSFYDTMKCSRCGITGKRYGLDDTVLRDKKYTAQVYARCDTSMKHRGIEREYDA